MRDDEQLITSINLTILGWFNYFKMAIYLIAVLGIPSSGLDSFIYLSAQNWGVLGFRYSSLIYALYTVPYEPDPSS